MNQSPKKYTYLMKDGEIFESNQNIHCSYPENDSIMKKSTVRVSQPPPKKTQKKKQPAATKETLAAQEEIQDKIQSLSSEPTPSPTICSLTYIENYKLFLKRKAAEAPIELSKS